jgi:putative hydrolase of the HAD superfamily
VLPFVDVRPPAVPKAILLDCLGTLVRLEPPAPRLAAVLEVDLADAERAMVAEIAFYRAHMDEARDAAGLASVRERCAALVTRELGVPCTVPDLLSALSFVAFDDAKPGLRALREQNVRLVVVSNWDVSLHEVLATTGLAPLLDGAVSSAEVGAAKPDPRPVERGLEIAGVSAADAWLVGDTPEADVAAARAAGVRPVLINRAGGGDIASLAELASNFG